MISCGYVAILENGREVEMNPQLLRESFNLIEEHKDRFAADFYRRFFNAYPETQKFFAHTDMKRQEQALITMLSVVVSGVERGENLSRTLKSLGGNHKQRGIHPQHYQYMSEIPVETLQYYLGRHMKIAYKEAWIHAIERVARTMND